jgi:hypothetical protein
MDERDVFSMLAPSASDTIIPFSWPSLHLWALGKVIEVLHEIVPFTPHVTTQNPPSIVRPSSLSSF